MEASIDVFEEFKKSQDELSRRLAQQESNQLALFNQIKLLTDELARANLAAHPAPVPVFHEPAAAEAGHEPRLALPARYSGQPGKCKIFLAQCQNYFNTLPSQFAAESRRIGFIIALLDGQALEWAGPLLDKNSDIIRSLDKLKIELISVFDHNTTDQEAAVRLVNLIQGKKSVAEYSIAFRSIASATGWADPPLITTFIRSLSESVKDALAMIDIPKTLDAVVQIAIRIDNRVREREKEKGANKGSQFAMKPQFSKTLSLPLPPTDSDPEPMQVDGAVRRKTNYKGRLICYHCREPGHVKPACPKLNAPSL